MTENVENLVLEQLRQLRNDVRDFRSSMETELSDVKYRLTSLERLVLTDKRDIANIFEDHARQQVSLDQVIERIRRIERRLELQDAEK